MMERDGMMKDPIQQEIILQAFPWLVGVAPGLLCYLGKGVGQALGHGTSTSSILNRVFSGGPYTVLRFFVSHALQYFLRSHFDIVLPPFDTIIVSESLAVRVFA